MQQEAYGRLARFIAQFYCIFIGDRFDVLLNAIILSTIVKYTTLKRIIFFKIENFN